MTDSVDPGEAFEGEQPISRARNRFFIRRLKEEMVDWGERYDIRSESPTGEKRFIEVKGRAQSGAIVLTGPELDKLRQLGERAWLYVVTFCKGERPRLRIIQDPIPKLNPEMLYRQVQFLMGEADWAGQGEEATLGGGLE